MGENLTFPMFNDKRSRKIIVLAHCLLNQNSISDGTADLPGQFTEVINLLMKNNIGIIQLPCPELVCLGLDRQDRLGAERDLLIENTRIRSLLEKQENLEMLRKKAEEIVFQIEEYSKHGFEIFGIVGVNRSPSCGIETTTKESAEQNGRGVFMEILESELEKRGIKIRMTGTKTSMKEESVQRIKEFITK